MILSSFVRTVSGMDWTRELGDQLDWYWQHLFRPRLEGPYAEHPTAALVLHINREAIHHGAEVALLRDLYLHSTGLATTA